MSETRGSCTRTCSGFFRSEGLADLSETGWGCHAGTEELVNSVGGVKGGGRGDPRGPGGPRDYWRSGRPVSNGFADPGGVPRRV